MLEGFFPVITPDKKEIIFKHFKLSQIMTSLFYLRTHEKRGKIHETFPYCQKIFLDSGIFQMYKRNLNDRFITEYREDLINLYNKLQPDFASALDIPFTIWDRKEAKMQKTRWSLENYEYVSGQVDDSIVLVPGICAFSAKSARFVTDKIKEKIGFPEYLGIGGQVPLLKTAEKSPNLALLTMTVVSTFRKEFPKAKIHVFGAGGHRWYMLLRLIGANSADYAGYLFSTGMGEIILPGIRPKYILNEVVLQTRYGKKKYRRDPQKVFTEEELEEFYCCHCPACKQNSPVLLELNKNYRLLHNLFVVNSEAQIVENYCKKEDLKGLQEHIRERLLNKDSGIKLLAKKTLQMANEKLSCLPA